MPWWSGVGPLSSRVSAFLQSPQGAMLRALGTGILPNIRSAGGISRWGFDTFVRHFGTARHFATFRKHQQIANANAAGKQLCPSAAAPSASKVHAEHVRELKAGKVRFREEELLATARRSDGKVIFLETGNDRAGLTHIINEHRKAFAGTGIAEEEIADLVMAAVTSGKQIGLQNTRPIYEVVFKGRTHRIAVTISDNGFIVGANPRGTKR